MKNGYSKIQKSRNISNIEDDSDLIASLDQQGDDGIHIHGDGAESGTSITDTSSVVLRRNCSASSITSSTGSGFQSAVKRALSMRRSSSVSESYSRIHRHYYVNVTSLASPPIPVNDDEEEGGIENISTSTSVIEKEKKKKKIRGGGGNILKACKRLFGL